MTRFKVAFAGILCFLAMHGLAFAGSYTDFFRAISNDDDGTVRSLMLRGFDPNTLTEEGQPAISFAMYKGAAKCVRVLLLSKQLNVNQADMHGDTPIMVASALDNSGWVAALISEGASVNRPGQWAPLHYAAASGSLKAVQMLLDAGADINAKSANGTTPLMMAARENKAEVARYLLQKGADPSVVNQSEYNAAGYAMRAKNKDLAMDIMKKEKALRDSRSQANANTKSS